MVIATSHGELMAAVDNKLNLPLAVGVLCIKSLQLKRLVDGSSNVAQTHGPLTHDIRGGCIWRVVGAWKALQEAHKTIK